MQIKEMLYVSADAFFDQLAKEVAYDVTVSTNRKMRPKQVVKGLTYTKRLKSKMGSKGDVKVTIMDFQRPTIYRAKFEGPTGTNYLTYEVELMDDEEKIGVTYTEDFQGKSQTKKWNYTFMMLFYNRRSKKKAKHLLRSMETYIQKEVQGKQVNEEMMIKEEQ